MTSTPSQATANSSVPQTRDVINLLIHGFTPLERQMLNAIVLLSQKRKPRIAVQNSEDVTLADVVLIDSTDPTSKKWAEGLPWLKDKALIWVDAAEASAGINIKRPVQWSTLPALLNRALEQDTGAASESAPVRAIVPPGVQASVLVVDDSLAVRSMLRSLLESHGLKVTDVDNAEAALQAVTSMEFSCILLDVMMPGMDGYEACRKIKGRATGNPAVIMLTSKSSAFDKIRGKMAGSDAYLTKPVEPDELTEVIRSFIASPGETGAGASSEAAAL
jgi:two-component system cell cycle response regulator